MANAYTQLYVQLIFAVKNHQAMIDEPHRDVIEKYICGIAKNIKCRPLSIYCNPDHTHLLLGLHQTVAVADAVRDIKSFSSRFINENRLVKDYFDWQTGYGGFSYGKSQVDAVCRYIANQHEHHKKVSFKEEYLSFLKAFDVPYDERYLFDWIE
jgi:REP element-mobilizing transposase RayT